MRGSFRTPQVHHKERRVGPPPQADAAAPAAIEREDGPAQDRADEPEASRGDASSDPDARSARAARARLLRGHRIRPSGRRAFSLQHLHAARLLRGGVPAHPVHAPDDRGAGAPRSPEDLRAPPRRARHRHGPDRLGKVDDARRDHARNHREAPGSHRDDRGPDRISSSPTASRPSRSARSGPTRPRSTRRCGT